MDGNTTTYQFTDVQQQSSNAGLVNSISSSDGNSVSRTWSHNQPLTQTAYTDQSQANPYISVETRTAGGSTAAATRTTAVDYNGNPLTQTDSDWGSATILRTVATAYATPTPQATSQPAQDNFYAYWNPSSPPLRSLVACRTITGPAGSGPGAVTQYFYDDAGDQTQEYDWDSTKGGTLPACTAQPNSNNYNVTVRSFDVYGNPVAIDDPSGNETRFAYDSNSLYLTTKTEAAGSALQRSTSYSFDANTGLLNSQTDYNGLTTAYGYDNAGRTTSVTESGTPGVLAKTTVQYEDANRRVVTVTDSVSPNDQLNVAVTDYDQLGRVRLARQLENPGTQLADRDSDGIKVQTRYGYSGSLSYQIVSNPYRADYSYDAGSEQTMGWTLAASNWTNRSSTVTASVGAAAPALTAISCPGSGTATGSRITCLSGNVTTVTDEAGVQHVNTSDGLGRLKQVIEAGIAATTNYGFDVLGNVTSVSPASGNGRTFVYDSLSRLQTAVNPESGTTNYSYDRDSNLVQRADGRGIASYFLFDGLNRLTDKEYSDYGAAQPTPWTHYGYQGTTDFVSSVTSGTTVYSYSGFDALGRPGAGTQTTNGQAFAFTNLQWTPAGQVKSMQYPSGRVVTTNFDALGRLAGLSGSLNGAGTTYASGISYAAQGAPAGMSTGDNLARSWGYDGRLRATSITAGSQLTLGMNWNNNGTLQSQTIARPGWSASQSFGYDGVARLSSAVEGGNWSQSYVYDKAGNRAVNVGSTIPLSNYTPQSPDGLSVPFDAANHWQAAAGYDAAGNMTALRTQTMTFDAESRLTGCTDANGGATAAFRYDGDGRRVTKTSAAGTVIYVYDPAGNLAAESGGAPPSTTGPVYLTQDHLGSTRLVTNAGGCVGAHDYLPFGEEIPGAYGRGPVSCYGIADTGVKFTGQERDAETGLDNFLARHMAAPQGRFVSPDPDNAGADAGNPQSWNGYGYGLNSPLVYVDPDGTDPFPPTCYLDGFQTDCGQAQQLVNSGAASQCPNNQCTSYSQQYGFLQYSAYGNGLSGYVPFGKQPYQIQETIFGQTYTSYGNILFPQNSTSGSNLGGPLSLAGGVVDVQIASLFERIQEHLTKLAENPLSRDVPHWTGEIRGWREQILKKATRLTQKRSAGALDKYLKRIIGLSSEELNGLFPSPIIIGDPCVLNPTLSFCGRGPVPVI